jgi:hypothetical protein
MNEYALALGYGVAAAILFLAVAGVATIANRSAVVSRHRFLLLIEGADGRLSTSKFQWFAWTTLVVGSYAAIYAARALTGQGAASPQVPSNVLIALGFSTTTMATAKGITTLYLAGGRTLKEPSPNAANSANASIRGGLLTDDSGITDLAKVQLVTWTLIAIAVYLYSVGLQLSGIFHCVPGKTCQYSSIPDIDTVLMVLTGLSQGGYLGKKLVDSTKTSITLDALVPSTVTIGSRLRVYGSNFGDPLQGTKSPADSFVTFDGVDVPDPCVLLWTDNRIDVEIDSTTRSGAPWLDGQQVAVGVISNRAPSSSTLTLTVKRT